MTDSQVYCIFDYETFSIGNLKLIGAWEYAKHPSTRMLCVSWTVGTLKELRSRKTPIHVWSPYLPSPYGEFKRALLDPSVIMVAHNAGFEQVITKFVLPRYIHDPAIKEISPERFMCTASMARAVALPGKLEHACAALRLNVQKDMEGHRLMLKMSKPRKPTKHNPAKRHCKVSDLKRLMDYCKTDVEAERELFLSVPFLSPAERELWLLDQKMNQRGFHTDRALCKKAIALTREMQAEMTGEIQALTHGKIQSPDQRDAVLKWVNARGANLPNLQAKTLSDELAGARLSGDVRRVVEIRQAASKTSLAKYPAFEMRSRSDGRTRDNLVYHTASTGRFGGAGVQVHNLPRPTIKNTDEAAEIILEPDTTLDHLKLIWGNPLEALSNTLRSVIVPTPGKKLFGGDFNGIEVRVLFWFANHSQGLDAYRKDRDLYCELASVIYGCKITKEDSVERDLGKRAVLGCGFGMGAKKFQETCETWGSPIDFELAKRAVFAYRSLHNPVVKLWQNIEQAAIAATRNPGAQFKIHRTKWWVADNYLWCELPSGRRLAYYGPKVRMQQTPWGEERPQLCHWGVHPIKKTWVFGHTYGGKLVENIVQATARDLMTAAMPRAEKAGYELLITVHDELLTEKEKGSANEFEKLMTRNPAWAEGLPVKVAAWEGPRFRK